MDTLSNEILIHIFAQGTAKEIVNKISISLSISISISILSISRFGGEFLGVGMA